MRANAGCEKRTWPFPILVWNKRNLVRFLFHVEVKTFTPVQFVAISLRALACAKYAQLAPIMGNIHPDRVLHKSSARTVAITKSLLGALFEYELFDLS